MKTTQLNWMTRVLSVLQRCLGKEIVLQDRVAILANLAFYFKNIKYWAQNRINGY